MELCGFSRLSAAPSHAGELLAAFQYTGSHISILRHSSLLPREMDRLSTLSLVDALLKAGADANVKRDVSEIEWAIAHDLRRLWPILFRGGAVIPNNDDFAAWVFEGYTTNRAHPYLRKIETAGGWKAYEKAHRTKLLATFVPKFTHLVPKELVPLIVEFSFHVGFY